MSAPRIRTPREVASEVLTIEAQAIEGQIARLDDAFDQAVVTILGCRGRVVCTGMGKSGLVLQKVAATLASTGTPAMFLHPAEAIHGDLGMLVEGDVVLAASYSGTTEELLRLLETLKRLAIPLIAMTGNSSGPIARHADIHLPVLIDKEACPLNLAPTASTTATLAVADALAMAVMESRGFTVEDFARLHPGGRLGKRLLRVDQIMHEGEAVPRVKPQTAMPDVIYEMSRKGLGATSVVDDRDRLLGIITDGDLRRLLGQDKGLLERSAADCMVTNPKRIRPDALAPEALKALEDHRITSLCVVDPATETLLGLVHLHDLWRLELF